MKRLHTATVIRNITIRHPLQGVKYQINGIVCAEDRPWTVEDLIRWLPDQIPHTNITTVSGPGVGFIKKQFIGTGYLVELGSTFSWAPNEVVIAEDNWHNIEDDNWHYIDNTN